jgi:high-affinity iron transporter
VTGRRLFLFYTLGLATLSAAAVPPAPAGFELKGDPVRGKAIFATRCALCHGPAGDGKGKVKQDNPPPTDFTNAALMGKRSDWEIYLVARDGGQAIGLSSKMFGWGKLLPDQDLRDAVAYVRSLAKPQP